jgi:hypothetical protein
VIIVAPTENTPGTTAESDVVRNKDMRGLRVNISTYLENGRIALRVVALGNVSDGTDRDVWRYGLDTVSGNSPRALEITEDDNALLRTVENAIRPLGAEITSVSGYVIVIQAPWWRMPQVWRAVRKAIVASRKNAGYASVHFEW